MPDTPANAPPGQPALLNLPHLLRLLGAPGEVLVMHRDAILAVYKTLYMQQPDCESMEEEMDAFIASGFGRDPNKSFPLRLLISQLLDAMRGGPPAMVQGGMIEVMMGNPMGGMGQNPMMGMGQNPMMGMMQNPVGQGQMNGMQNPYGGPGYGQMNWMTQNDDDEPEYGQQQCRVM